MRPNRSAKKIYRAWIEDVSIAFPSCGGAATQTKQTPRQERNSDHDFEYFFIAMPADRRSRTIFADKNVRELVRLNPGKPGSSFTNRQKEIRDR